ncbi:Tetratricopeptide-like helical domain superfamily [Sesbania bispinosa]|nr:Tetratricopeptide-like helical domain superfamily [Sesbania bispinosa]
MDIGESYQKLRNFNKAIKWYKKSWEMYKTISNSEGQALVSRKVRCFGPTKFSVAVT